jgi:hypothetical protein
MHRAACVIGGGATAILLAACSTPTANQTVTASLSQNGYTVQMVIESDSTAIADIEKSPSSNAYGFSGLNFSDGDVHSEPHVCGFTGSHNGHTYQVDFYGNLRSGAAAYVCTTTERQEFLAGAP